MLLKRSLSLRMMELEAGESDTLAKWMVVAAVATLGSCIAIIPPYGRYSRSVVLGIRFPLVNAKVAWFLMECPNVVMASWLLYYCDDAYRSSPANMALLCMFVVHYIHRSFVFSLRMRGGRPMPVLVMVFAALFCICNSYLQCSHLLRSKLYPTSWLRDPRFVIGSATFMTGAFINCHSDGILRRLRRPGETGYRIPRGGMFEYVSAANYFGECLEWCGFGIACWSLPAASFSLYTAANLVPRAYRHHKWYLEKFKEDYPYDRRIFIPFIW